jgi:hypothetical protein
LLRLAREGSGASPGDVSPGTAAPARIPPRPRRLESRSHPCRSHGP